MGYSESDLPSRYARDWLTRARARLADQAPAMRALQAQGLLAGVPTEILCAFIAPGSARSNTTDATAGKGLEVAFHEVGYYQVPAGPADRDPATKRPRAPAPNPNPAAPNNAWGRLARDPDVVRALGHPATMAPDGWKSDLAAQHAVGFAMLRDDYRAAVRNLPAEIAPSGWNTPWGTAVMFTAFSAGPGGAAALFRRYAARLATVGEAFRFGALINAVCVDLQAGWKPGGTPDHHNNPVHRVLRTWQKFELARAISAPDAAVFFDPHLDDAQLAHERLVLRGNWNLAPGPERVAALAWPG